MARGGARKPAEAHYRRAAAIDPTFKDYWMELASYYEANQERADAIGLYREFPNNPGAMERMGMLQLESGNAPEAVRALEAAVADSPTPANRVALAQAYVKNKQPTQAIPQVASAVASAPQDSELRMFYARLLRDERKFPDAAREFRTVTDQQPDNVTKGPNQGSSSAVCEEVIGPAPIPTRRGWGNHRRSHRRHHGICGRSFPSPIAPSRCSPMTELAVTYPGASAQLRDTVEVKLLAHGDEVYVLAKSQGRRAKETAMRRRKLAKLLRTLRALRRTRQRPWKRDTLLHKLGAAHSAAGQAWGFVKITVPTARQPVNRDTFKFELLKDKLKDAQERDGHYLLRAFRAGDQAGTLWELYMQLTEIEAAFKTLKSDLHLRPIRHHIELRIEAHILVCFLAYCLSVTLRKRLEAHAPGLTPQAVLETLSGILMIDVHLPLADGRELVLPRYTQPEPEHRLVLEKLGWELPAQPPPRIRSPQVAGTPKAKETKSKM